MIPDPPSILSLKKGRKWCMWVLYFLANCGGIEPTLRSQVPVKLFHVPSGVNFCKVLNKRSFTLSNSSPAQLQRTVLGLRCGMIGTNPLPVPIDLVFTFLSCSDRFGILRPVWRSLPLCTLLLCFLTIVFQLPVFSITPRLISRAFRPSACQRSNRGVRVLRTQLYSIPRGT